MNIPKVFKIIYVNCPGNVCPGKWLSCPGNNWRVRARSCTGNVFPGNVLFGKRVVPETSVRETSVTHATYPKIVLNSELVQNWSKSRRRLVKQ